MAKPVEVKEGLCYMCTSACATKVHVQNGRVIKIDIANPQVAHCPRWKAQLDFIYHPERLQYPVIRAGKRGDGSWQRISWDEAPDMVTVTSPRGSIKMKANVTNNILDGVVSLPHDWPEEANVNVLVDNETPDPISGFIPCKSQLCQVAKV